MKRACRSVKDSRTPAGPLIPLPNSDHCIHQFSLADHIRLLPGLVEMGILLPHGKLMPWGTTTRRQVVGSSRSVIFSW